MSSPGLRFLDVAVQSLSLVLAQNSSVVLPNSTANSSNSSNSSSNNTSNNPPINPDYINNTTNPMLEYSLYLHQEYVNFLLPCYYFLAAGTYRYLSVLKQPLEENTTDSLHNSYNIKRRLSILMMVLYILSILCSVFMDPQNFWQAYFPSYGFVYIFGAGAWLLSYLLLGAEREKDLPQQTYTHRAFWISSFVIFVIKLLFLSQMRSLNVVVNVTSILATAILGIYGMYKPFDSDSIQRRDNFTMPDQASSFFRSFEDLFFVRYFCSDFRLRHTGEAPLLPKRSAEHRKMVKELHEYIQKNKSIAEEDPSDYMKKGLPTDLKIALAWKVGQRDSPKLETYFYFEVKTIIEGNEFIQEKKYSDFLTLEQQLHTVFNNNDYPTLATRLPQFAKINIDKYPSERQFVEARIEILEKYLRNIFNEPAFVNHLVLDFLGIEDPYRAPYETYSRFVSNTQKFKTKKHVANEVSIEMPTIKSQTPGDTTTGYSGVGITPNYTVWDTKPATTKPNASAPAEPVFQAYCESSQKSFGGNVVEYIFVISDKANPKQEPWKIIKTFAKFTKLQASLETESGRTIDFFKQHVPTQKNVDPQKRKEGLEKYLSAILKDKSYYSKSLYEFLEYNIDKRMPIANETGRMSINDGPRSGENNFGTQSTITSKPRLDASPENLSKSAINSRKGGDSNQKRYYRTVYTGPFKRSVSLNFARIKVPTLRYVRKGNDVFTLYELVLEQFDSKDASKVKIRVISFKSFKEIEDLDYFIHKFYQDREVAVPILKLETPSLFGSIDPEQLRTNVEDYLNKLLALPAINEYQMMRDFLQIENLRSDYREPRTDEEVFDYRDDTHYDEIVEGNINNSSMVKELLKKADFLHLIPGINK